MNKEVLDAGNSYLATLASVLKTGLICAATVGVSYFYFTKQTVIEKQPIIQQQPAVESESDVQRRMGDKVEKDNQEMECHDSVTDLHTGKKYDPTNAYVLDGVVHAGSFWGTSFSLEYHCKGHQVQ